MHETSYFLAQMNAVTLSFQMNTLIWGVIRYITTLRMITIEVTNSDFQRKCVFNHIGNLGGYELRGAIIGGACMLYK